MPTKKIKEKKEIKMKSELPIVTQEGKTAGTYALDSTLFNGKVNTALLHQFVVSFLANQRRGTASTKTRGEVRGGGKRPWRQKGTGRARVGSSRNPIWTGGGVVFGPKPRDFSKALPKKMKLEALRSSLNSKLKDESIIVLDDLNISEPKTKKMEAVFKALKLTGKLLVVVDKVDKNIKLSCRNLHGKTMQIPDNLNAYDVIVSDKLLVTQRAFDNLGNRFKQGKRK